MAKQRVHLIFGYEDFNISPLTLARQTDIARDLTKRFPEATISFFDDDSGFRIYINSQHYELSIDDSILQLVADICLWLGFEVTR
jgi:hypothetical protein